MEANHFYRQGIQHALAVVGDVQTGQSYTSDQVESLSQVAPTSVEAALGGYARKQIEMEVSGPVAEQLGFLVPPFAFTNQSHTHQLAIRALRHRTGAFEAMRHLLPNVINYTVRVHSSFAHFGLIGEIARHRPMPDFASALDASPKEVYNSPTQCYNVGCDRSRNRIPDWNTNLPVGTFRVGAAAGISHCCADTYGGLILAAIRFQ
jgi:hypothetical protein